jgi:hypothetical protein
MGTPLNVSWLATQITQSHIADNQNTRQIIASRDVQFIEA